MVVSESTVKVTGKKEEEGVEGGFFFAVFVDTFFVTATRRTNKKLTVRRASKPKTKELSCCFSFIPIRSRAWHD